MSKSKMLDKGRENFDKKIDRLITQEIKKGYPTKKTTGGTKKKK